MNPHADYNGSSLVLIVAVLVAAMVTGIWARQQLKAMGLRCRDVLYAGTPRILVGAAVIFVGVALGRIFWWPVRPMLIARNTEWQNWYALVAAWPANLANLATVVGLAIILWPALVRWFGRLAWPIVIMSVVVVYLVGALTTLWWAKFF
jgi:hypothetical protein